jgi:hypothetical protein
MAMVAMPMVMAIPMGAVREPPLPAPPVKLGNLVNPPGRPTGTESGSLGVIIQEFAPIINSSKPPGEFHL